MSRLGSRRRRSSSRVSVSRVHGGIERLESRVLLSTSADAAASALLAPAIPLSNTTWTPIGPAPSANGNIAGNGPVSGRVTGVATDPTNSNVIYLASAGGGVWKTTDGGNSWAPLTDNQSTLFMGAIAVAPTSPNVVYAATGDSTNSGQSFYGRGILKSTNAGATWTLLGSNVFNRKTFSRIVVDPTNPNIVYAALAGGGTNGTGGNTGIWKTTDGGSTWTNTTTAISTSDRFTDVAIDPTNPQHLFCTRLGNTVGNGVYVTFNGGASWALVGGGLPSGLGLTQIKVAISPSNPQVVYASFPRGDFHTLGIWRSNDGGVNWAQCPNVPDYLDGNAFYSTTLAVDPNDSNVVYAGGVAGFLQSADGGQTWTNITVSSDGTTGTHWDPHATTFDASGRLIDGTDGGVWRLDNATPGSIAWSDLNTNLQISTFLEGAIDPTNPNNLFAVGQDNALTQFSGSTTWTQRDVGGAGPDRGFVLVDQQNPSRVYEQSDIGEAGPTNFIRRSDDGGATWTSIANGIDPTEAQSGYAAFAIDPSNGNHLVYGTDRVYETFDGGDTWNPISTPNTNGWNVNNTVTISHLAIAATDPKTIYATIAGHVFVTTNGGSTWRQSDPNNNPFGGLVVDPNNPNIVFTMGNGFGLQKVMRSADAGVTWQSVGGFLPDLPTFTLVDNNGILYVGNDNGVYTTTDDGSSWTKLGAGLPNAQVRDLEFNPATNTLVAFTYGRGAWEISTVPSAPLVVNTLSDEVDPADGLTSLREAIATANVTGQAILLDPSLAGGTINLDPANGALVINRSITVTAPNGNVTINANGFPVEAAGSNIVRLSNFSFASSGGPALQIDSAAWLNISNLSSTADITDNGRFSIYSYVDGQISGAINGAGNLNKLGAYALRLTGNNTYTGQTSVSGGQLIASTAVLKNTVAVTGGATVVLDESSLPNSEGTFNANVFGNGNIRIPAGSTVHAGTFGAGPAVIKNVGLTIVDPGARLVADSANNLGGGPWDVEGIIDMAGFDQTILSLTGGGTIYNLTAQANPLATLTIGNAVSTTFSGSIQDTPAGSGNPGVVALKKVGTSTLTLTGPNSYSGGTTLSAGSMKGNTLGLQGNINAPGPSVLNLTIDQSLSGVNDGTFNGTITGYFNLTINGGTVRLGATSALKTNAGITVNGTLIAGAANQFGPLDPLDVNGTFDMNGFDQTLNQLYGTGAVLNNEPAGQSGTATLTIAVFTQGLFTGIIEDHTPGADNGGVLALNLYNANQLTGANTYSGGTTIAGTTIGGGFGTSVLTVGPSVGDPLGTGPVTIAAGSLVFAGQITPPAEHPLSLTGFNEDVIADAGATDPVSSTTTSVDNPAAGGAYVWYEQGFEASQTAGTGLPAGQTFTSLANSSVTFQLQPADANNVALLTGNGATVDLTLTQPGHFTTLHFLAASANGTGEFSATMHFSDGTSKMNFYVVPDWFNGANPAYVAGGRVFRLPDGELQLPQINPRLYEFDYTLFESDVTKVLTGITLTDVGSQRVGIYAVSGAEFNYLPSQAYPNAIRVNTDAEIDVQNSASVSLGDLTIGGNALTLTAPAGEAVSFASVHLTADHVFDVPAGMTFTLGPISDGGAGYSTGLTDSGTLVFAGTNTYGGSTSVSTGTLIASTAGAFPSHTALSVTNNGVVVFPSTGPAFTATLGSLSLDPGTKLDLGNKALWINYAANPDPLANIQAYLKTGYDAGAWDGLNAAVPSGAIVSSAAASDPNKSTAVGYRDLTTALRNGVPAQTLWLSYTLYGDADLNGTVNALDLIPVALNYGKTGRRWDQGDFNYDFTVNVTDVQALIANFGASRPTSAAPVISAMQSTAPAVVTPFGKSRNSKAKHHPHRHARG